MKHFITILCVFFLMSCSNIGHQYEEPSILKSPEKSIIGDINRDGQLTIADLTELIDGLMVGETYPWYDINGDGQVTVADITALIDLMLTNEIIDDGIYEVNGVQFKMIDVEGGTFTMGAKNTEPSSFTFEKPLHEVTLSSFKIGETEVTQELWTAVMGYNPSINKSDPKNPVEYVSWDDCKAFIVKLNELTNLNFRLPTEAEWEYAAIGGKYTHYYKFSGSERAADVAWYITNSNGSSHPVKGLAPNEIGTYDMSGNVYEWVNDWYDRYTADPQVNPQGPETGTYKVYRGGAWNVGAGDSRCHFRYMRETTYKTPAHGFRLAL